MAYADLLQEEGIRSEYLIVLKPRRKVTSWTLVAAGVYKIPFSLSDFGEVIGLTADDVTLTQGSSTTPAQGEFYYDIDNSELYVHLVGGINPNTKFTVATFERYVGTIDAHAPRVPTDSSKRVVYFDPIVQNSPTKKDSLKDILFGFSGDLRSAITLINAEHWAEKILYDSSFNHAEVQVYHWLGEAEEVTDRKKVFQGLCKNIQYSDDRVVVQIFDQRSMFNEEWRNEDASFYTFSDFPSLDPKKENKPIPFIYGVTFIGATNVDYEDEAPSSTDNREWVVGAGDSDLGSVTQTVAASPASTTTRTYLVSASGMRVGDSVRVNKAAPESRKITAAQYSSPPFIEHAAFAGAAALGGNSVDRNAVGIVEIIQDGVLYEALIGEHYTGSLPGAGTFGFEFTAGLDSGGTPLLPSVLTPNDEVHVRVYGKKNNVILGGSPFGGNDAGSDPTGNLTNPAVIVFDILKNFIGIAETDINTATFTALEASVDEALGFAIPSESMAGKFPTFKDILIRISKSVLFRLFVSSENAKWSLKQLSPFAAADFSVEEDEIKDGSFSYDFSYDQDLFSKILVQYAFKERSSNPNLNESETLLKEATSLTARYLHKIEKTETFDDVLLFRDADAQKLADRLSYVYGDRRGEISLTVKNRFFESDLADRLDVSKVRLPGTTFDNETKITQSLSITDTDLSLSEIKLSGDDQKGIQDNSGSW